MSSISITDSLPFRFFARATTCNRQRGGNISINNNNNINNNNIKSVEIIT